ncbi:MAG: hypothetical protein J7L15_04480 [Clostridiales bacterium]|nr:hypothetical protein [Clostridiales bacterium]
MSKEINEDANLSIIAQAIKGKGLFDMDKPLKQAGFKTTSMGYSASTALKVTKGSKNYMIAFEKNAEPGDIVQDGIVIGVWK